MYDVTTLSTTMTLSILESAVSRGMVVTATVVARFPSGITVGSSHKLALVKN